MKERTRKTSLDQLLTSLKRLEDLKLKLAESDSDWTTFQKELEQKVLEKHT